MIESFEMKKDKIQFAIEQQPGEELSLLRQFRGSHGHVFAMGVSNQAVYVSAQKLGFKNDGWYLKRIPLSEVKEVRLIRERPIGLVVVAMLMVLFGTTLSLLMMWRALNPMPGVVYHVSGWPFAIAVGGVIVPFIARQRRILFIRFKRGKFKWKPQLAIDKATRQFCAQIQEDIVNACNRVGVSTEVS